MGYDQRIPVVAGLAYAERLQRLPSTFPVTLVTEPDNRYFRHAIAVLANGEKVGYVAPEIAPQYFDAVRAASAPITCIARRGTVSDHETSGVELLLDGSGLEVDRAE
jgi:HIRAN domain-containing protein